MRVCVVSSEPEPLLKALAQAGHEVDDCLGTDVAPAVAEKHESEAVVFSESVPETGGVARRDALKILAARYRVILLAAKTSELVPYAAALGVKDFVFTPAAPAAVLHRLENPATGEEAADALAGATLPAAAQGEAAPEGKAPPEPEKRAKNVRTKKARRKEPAPRAGPMILGLVLPAYRQDLFAGGHKLADLAFALAESLPGKAVTVADLTGWASPYLEPGQSEAVFSVQEGKKITVRRFSGAAANALLLSEVRPPAVIAFPLERAGDALAVCALVFTIRKFDGAHYFIAPEFSDPARVARATGLATVGARDIKSAVPEILARGRSRYVAYPPGNKFLARANRRLAAFTGRAFRAAGEATVQGVRFAVVAAQALELVAWLATWGAVLAGGVWAAGRALDLCGVNAPLLISAADGIEGVVKHLIGKLKGVGG